MKKYFALHESLRSIANSINKIICNPLPALVSSGHSSGFQTLLLMKKLLNRLPVATSIYLDTYTINQEQEKNNHSFIYINSNK